MSEALYSLAEAVKRFFPDSGLTVTSLRTEIKKGRLEVERIAGKILVTESALMEMRKKCREEPKAPASISDGEAGELPYGSSSIAENPNLALTAAKLTAMRLKGGLPNTSPKNTSPRKQRASSLKPSSPTL